MANQFLQQIKQDYFMRNIEDQVPDQTEAVDTADNLTTVDSNSENAEFRSINAYADIMRGLRNNMSRGNMYQNIQTKYKFTTAGMPKGTKVPRGYGGY